MGDLPGHIIIIDSAPNVIDAMTMALEMEGYHITPLLNEVINKGEVDLTGFLKLHDPDIVLFDIPDKESWDQLQQDRRFIPTTVNEKLLKKVSGQENIEFLPKPYDVENLIKNHNPLRVLWFFVSLFAFCEKTINWKPRPKNCVVVFNLEIKMVKENPKGYQENELNHPSPKESGF